MGQKNKLPESSVVGIVDSPAAWRVAEGLPPGALDALEWRADCLPDVQEIPPSPFPWILTARHPREGGRGELSTAQRKALLLRLLPGADFLDVELRSMRGLREVRAEAAARNISRIASFHDFSTTPPPSYMRCLAIRAVVSGASIFKLATWTGKPGDIVRMLNFLPRSPIPLAAMGMGPLGFSSRLLFGSCGSALNYGWLDRPNVPGQWPALELKKLLGK